MHYLTPDFFNLSFTFKFNLCIPIVNLEASTTVCCVSNVAQFDYTDDNDSWLTFSYTGLKMILTYAQYPTDIFKRTS